MAEDRDQSVLRFEHVTLSFEGVPALNDISLDVRKGESRIILGSAGSGKTVLLKTAAGLLKPDSGSVFLFDRDIAGAKEGELFEIRSRVGILFQESALFDSLTIEENVAYPLRNQKTIKLPMPEVEKRVQQALHFVELDQTLRRFPSELSGGMRRRAAIARAVATGPPLLLYDSPTAGLDPITANTIIALIIKERDQNRTTTMMVTHRYQDGNLVAKFRYNPDNGRLEPSRDGGSRGRTRFLVLREGRIVFEGAQDELEKSQDPYLAKFVKHTDH